ncbi:MAG TPA: preprotein translocase subunit SecG [Paludibacteraceae bacterium]|nr:preprotein translocase subunit SecG [Paludibacteraceae bacterium]MBP8966460.1 preprotein translocase subunit SecG [Paludibacteraceae bacterium]HOF97870.1 preprotein translocase subunit SecG [Paludibacteraceae bacterium]HOJ66226.1 preprotein translocase subunit SecG [Paludibacteraceae bacterium]HOL28747.1 preprotein translocase subunit SecG [Paludibacteraceae bacterium]
MYLLFTILIIIASILLILIVLVQNSKGGGLAAGFSSSNQYMGVRKTADFLEKATWGLIAFIVVLSIGATGIHANQKSGGSDSEIKEQYQKAQEELPGVVAPDFGETQGAGNNQQDNNGGQQNNGNQQKAPQKLPVVPAK